MIRDEADPGRMGADPPPPRPGDTEEDPAPARGHGGGFGPETFARRPVLAAMLVLFMTTLGWFSYRELGVDLMPDVELPVVTVTTTLRGASPEEVEAGVTRLIEEAVNSTEGIDELRSTTTEGRSQVVVNFELGRDREEAVQDVRDRVAAVVGRLPEGTDPPIITKFDLDASPVLTLAVSGDRSLRELTDVARRRLKQGIETLPGVGAVEVVGGERRAFTAWLDADALAAREIGVPEVRAALRRENVEVPGGRVDGGLKERSLRTLGRLEEPEDFARIYVASRAGVPVRLGELARVEDGAEEPTSASFRDGKPAVSLTVRKTSGSNTVEVVDGVLGWLGKAEAGLPTGVAVDVIRDQSVFVRRSVGEVKHHLLLGAALTALTVLAFMRSLRSTLVAAVAIPASLITTFAVMRWQGFTLNNMTLLGLVIAVGIVVDDAIVVIENVFRHAEELGKKPLQAAIDGTREIALAVSATTFSLVVIFLPTAFMPGRVGRFFHSYGITVTAAILVSLVVAFTLTPALAARIVRATPGGAHSKGGRAWKLVDRGTAYLLHAALRHRGWVLLLSAALVWSSKPLFARLGMDFLPQDDRGEFEVVLQAPEGTSLTGTSALLREVEAEIRKLPGVRSLFSAIGATSGDVTMAAVHVQLADLHERDFPQSQVQRQARAVMKRFPSVRSSVQGYGNVGSGGGFGGELNLTLRSPEPEVLGAFATRLIEAMKATPGLVDVDSSLSVRRPELRVEVDRARAADLGVRVADVGESLRLLVGGEPVTRVRDGDEDLDVWARLEREDRASDEAIARLLVPGAEGPVPVGLVAHLAPGRGPAEIRRSSRQREVTIFANLDGIDLGGAMGRVNALMDELGRPPVVDPAYTGRGRAFLEAYTAMAMAFGLSLVFMYMVLAAQFESLLQPIPILLALPLALPFAILSLLWLGETLNIYSAFGLFLLAGVIKKNGILQVDRALQLERLGIPRLEAIVRANRERLRPILMTTLTLIAGMVPIALGEGPGAAARASMAKVIIGGQGLSLVITLLITPVTYSLLQDAADRVRRGYRPASGGDGREDAA